MKEISKVTIVGTGAIGATFAAKIHDTIGDNLRILADGDRYERYKRDGFIINDKKYDFNYVKPNEKVEPSDLVMIAVKYHHLDNILGDLENHIGENTIILSLLNGINSEEIVGSKFGMEKMLYSLVIRIDAMREKNVITHSLPGTIVFGEKENKNYSDKVKKVDNFFNKTGIKHEIPEDMMLKLWWKFMINVGINQTSAIMKAPYGVFQKDKEARVVLKNTMREVIKLANAMDIDLKEDDMQKFIDILYDLSEEGRTSMLQDVLAGRKTEVEMFAKVVCELGEKYNVETPINEMMYNMIKTIEKNYPH